MHALPMPEGLGAPGSLQVLSELDAVGHGWLLLSQAPGLLIALLLKSTPTSVSGVDTRQKGRCWTEHGT